MARENPVLMVCFVISGPVVVMVGNGLSTLSREGYGKLRHDRHGIRRIDLAEVQLASSETARIINRDIVLELIRASQPISRADLARRSGLGRSTVSQIVEQLIGEDWVREGAMGSLPRGRRPTLVGLNEDLVAIAVDIHPRQASVALVGPEWAVALAFGGAPDLRSR